MSVQLRQALDFAKSEAQNMRIQNLGSAPGSPVAGQIYYDTSTSPGTMQWYNGTAWINPLSRANHTGTQLASTISDLAATVQAYRLDQFAAPTAAVSMNSQRITNLADPTGAQDAATKAYVDAARAGLDTKQSVRVGSTANVAVTYSATGGASGRGQITAAPNTLDGVSLAAGNRLLLKNQTTGAQNGIWVVTTLGTGANGVWDRADDFDADAEVTAGAYMWVTEGTTNADTGWVLTTNDPITIGGASGTALTFVQFNGAGGVSYATPTIALGSAAGAGSLTTVIRSDATIQAFDATAVTTSAVGDAAAVGSINFASRRDHVHGREGFGAVVAVAYGDASANGTALTVSHSDHSHGWPANISRKFSVSVGDGSTTSITVTHSLNTKDVQVYCYDNTTPFQQILVEVQHATVNTVTLVFAVAPTTNQYRCVVVG